MSFSSEGEKRIFRVHRILRLTFYFVSLLIWLLVAYLGYTNSDGSWSSVASYFRERFPLLAIFLCLQAGTLLSAWFDRLELDAETFCIRRWFTSGRCYRYSEISAIHSTDSGEHDYVVLNDGVIVNIPKHFNPELFRRSRSKRPIVDALYERCPPTCSISREGT